MMKFKNSKPIRVDNEMLEMINSAKIDISKKINVNPKKISMPLATKKLTDWAKIGREMEYKFEKHPGKKWAEWMNSIT